MKNYSKLLKKFIEKKYRNSTIKDPSFIKQFQLFRDKKLQKILKVNKKNLPKMNLKHDKTCLFLKKIYFSQNKLIPEKKIIILYKKFEYNLALKIKYNQIFKKTSNKETNINSYIYLGLLINKCELLTNMHKINFVLKIVDKILNSKNFIKNCDLKNLEKLMFFEKKLLSKIR